MSFAEIGTAIYTEVDKLRTVDAVIWVVYNYDAKLKDSSFPCIIITPVDWEEIIHDTAYNEPTYNFSITLIDESNNNASNTESNMRTLSDRLMERLKDVVYVTLTNWCTVKCTRSYKRWRAYDQENLRVFQIIAKYTGIKPS